MNMIITFIFFGIAGLLVGTQLKSMCFNCNVDVIKVYEIVKKIFFYSIYLLIGGVIILLSFGIVSVLITTLF